MLQKYSENIGGFISLLGSTVILLLGGAHAVISTFLFIAAELTLTRYGHKIQGYSAGCFLFCVGDITLAFSESVAFGSYLFISLISMAISWLIGAIRYPLYLCAKKFNSSYLLTLSNLTQPVCGTCNLILRMPGIAAALNAKNYVLFIAIVSWAINDVLSGRLQERVASLLKK